MVWSGILFSWIKIFGIGVAVLRLIGPGLPPLPVLTPFGILIGVAAGVVTFLRIMLIGLGVGVGVLFPGILIGKRFGAGVGVAVRVALIFFGVGAGVAAGTTMTFIFFPAGVGVGVAAGSVVSGSIRAARVPDASVLTRDVFIGAGVAPAWLIQGSCFTAVSANFFVTSKPTVEEISRINFPFRM